MTNIGPQTAFSDALHAMKYRAPGEDFREAMNRVAFGLRDSDEHYHRFREILLSMRFLPAGRVQSAIGSSKYVTAMNCYVSGTIADSFTDGVGSIMARAHEAAATMRMGGGIGYDFSTLRPRGELIAKLQSQSSGPISFMHIFDAVCLATSSSGHRRGAQMGLLSVSHPDIEEFIHAKNNPDKLTGFNISVAVTDEFMEAVERGTEFPLRWGGKVYRYVDAAELWENIMRSTWDWAEPGVIFIDTINRMNNLWYAETIAATNPCCLSGDTLVAVAGRGPIPIRTLAEEGREVPVFAKNKMSGITHVSWGRAPRWVRKAAIVKVTFDDGSWVRCSDDHHFPTRDGRRVKAKDLKCGDSLFRFDAERNWRSDELVVDGRTEHHLIAEAKFGKEFDWGHRGNQYQVHHKNENHFDNSWDNIEVLTSREHQNVHHLGAKRSEETKIRIGAKTRDRNQDPEYMDRLRAAIKTGTSTEESRRKVREAREKLFITVEKMCAYCGGPFSFRADPRNVRKIERKLYCSQSCAVTYRNKLGAGRSMPLEQRRIISSTLAGRSHSDEHNRKVSIALKGKTKSVTHRAALAASAAARTDLQRNEKGQYINHKVVSVEPDGFEDVYNITVDKYHNYAIVTSDSGGKLSGVYTENSEQVLPPHGCCLLGSFNLVKYLTHQPVPAGQSPWLFDFAQLNEDIPVVVRAMDIVTDRTRYPLAEQRAEALSKRRMGLGVTGLANAAEAQGWPYGSQEFLSFEESVLECINTGAYRASAMLADEKGSFPLFDAERYLRGEFIKTLDKDTRALIHRSGMRNSHLTSIAPTGTISLTADNVSSGLEPVFAYETQRLINTPSGQSIEVIKDYGASQLATRGKLARDVTAREHLAVLTLAQRYIDSSISKTINMDGSIMSWVDFKAIYRTAWEQGAKGCSTFNASGKRGALMVDSDAGDHSEPPEDFPSCEVDLVTGRRSCE